MDEAHFVSLLVVRRVASSVVAGKDLMRMCCI